MQKKNASQQIQKKNEGVKLHKTNLQIGIEESKAKRQVAGEKKKQPGSKRLGELHHINK